ncbi:MAG: aldo/keto reductase [Deltaproteobacteria bacterium]|jgi:aryl-alcohol dehydrogenase-like predicted oxidoreductase|nr:aldo/keto reductase [Deltaproteobacteria bacterium]
MIISGWATSQGTLRYHQKFSLPQWAVHNVLDLTLSAVGVGTYLGNPDSQTDTCQLNALLALLNSGCNVIDCAPNYRNGRSEITIGRAIQTALNSKIIERDHIFVATKTGLVPESFKLPSHLPLTIDNSCFHPDYFYISLETSLKNLQLSSVDCIFLHNLELLKLSDCEAFPHRYKEIVASMENIVQMNMSRSWGISSWNGFRVKPDHPEYLSLEMLMSYSAPNLRYLQFPLGIWGSEAITGMWQNGRSILSESHNLGIFTNSSLFQGELPVILQNREDLIDSAVCFARDTPGVGVSLLGIKQMKHVNSWKRIQNRPPHNTSDIFSNFL